MSSSRTTTAATVEGIYVTPIIEAGETIEPLRDRIIGRVSLERLKDFEGKTIVEVNQEIDEDLASAVQAAGIERVKIRSVLTCESKRGVCILCYAAVTSAPARWWRWAKPSESSPRSPSASPAPSSPCVPSTSAARHRASPTLRTSKPRTPATGPLHQPRHRPCQDRRSRCLQPQRLARHRR